MFYFGMYYKKKRKMNIGYIGKSSTGEIVVLEEIKENKTLVYYEEIPLHPYHKKTIV